MADNVQVKFGADASQMAKEFEKMRDKIASLSATVDDLKDRSKQSGKAGKDAFKGMSDEISGLVKNAVGITAIYAAIKNGIQSVIEKTKELRALRDESAIKTSSSLNKIFKEYKLEGTDQDKMQGWLQGQAQSQKMKVDKLAEFVSAGANEGLQKEDLYSGKYKSAIELFNVNDKLTGEQAINLIQTGLQKKGTDFKKASKQDIDYVAKYLATIGKDLESADTELGQIDKKISFEEAIVLVDEAKKNRYGKGKKSASDINEAFKKGGIRKAAKEAGFESYEEFQQATLASKVEAETSLDAKVRIQKSSREAEIAVSENKKQFVFEESQRGERLNQALREERLAREEANGVNYADRVLADFGAKIFGEKAEKEARERRETGSGFDATEYAFNYYKNMIMEGNKKIEDQNIMRQKDLNSKPIEMNDSKGVR